MDALVLEQHVCIWAKLLKFWKKKTRFDASDVSAYADEKQLNDSYICILTSCENAALATSVCGQRYIYIYNHKTETTVILFLWLSTAISRSLFWLRHAGTDRSCFLRLNKSLIFYLCFSGRGSCARRWMTGKAPPMMKWRASGWIIAGSAEYPLFLLA